MNYLGLDYGKSHIGLAIANGPLPEPLTTLPNDSHTLGLLLRLIQIHHIESIVIGNCDQLNTFEPFVEDLRSHTGLPVYIQDETLTTHDAVAALTHKSPRHRHALEHQTSAALILEHFLDSHTHNN